MPSKERTKTATTIGREVRTRIKRVATHIKKLEGQQDALEAKLLEARTELGALQAAEKALTEAPLFDSPKGAEVGQPFSED